MHARYFVGQVARFGRVDPMGRASTSPQRLNGYSYALNNPLAVTDPTGLAPEQGPIYTNGEYTVIGQYLPLTYLDPGGLAAVALYLQAMYDFGSEVDGWIVRHALRLFGLRREREIRASQPSKEPPRPEINEPPHPNIDQNPDPENGPPDDGGSGEGGDGGEASGSCGSSPLSLSLSGGGQITNAYPVGFYGSVSSSGPTATISASAGYVGGRSVGGRGGPIPAAIFSGDTGTPLPPGGSQVGVSVGLSLPIATGVQIDINGFAPLYGDGDGLTYSVGLRPGVGGTLRAVLTFRHQTTSAACN